MSAAEFGHGLSVKQLREARKARLAECVEQARQAETAVKRARAEEAKIESLASRQLTAHAAHKAKLLEEVEQRRAAAAAAASEVPGVAEELRRASELCEEAEYRASYGLYARWRRHLDDHLCAGGSVAQSDDPRVCLDPVHGYISEDKVAKLRQEEKDIEQQRHRFAEQVDEAGYRSAELRLELLSANSKRTELRRDLAEERRRGEEWWYWHKNRLPEICQQSESLRRSESKLAILQGDLEEGRSKQMAVCREEDEAERELREAKEEFEVHEHRVEHVLAKEEEASRQWEEMNLRATLGPRELERLDEVRRVTRRLEEMDEECRTLEEETREARRTESQVAIERQSCHFKVRRTLEELLDAERHIELLRERRTLHLRTLGDRERERRELLQAHAEAALDLERQKVALASIGALNDRIESDRQAAAARSASPMRGGAVWNGSSPATQSPPDPGWREELITGLQPKPAAPARGSVRSTASQSPRPRARSRGGPL
eukprot:gnl/TRDRNA2_/TRDRNA2_36270_c0_seq1.p1 gnl/TRDRNA2_/TRDRNA2_36270_c0~~gnl/TRDRNA2_/TRDRNA2_36270_c0_seq1.p1  ORF type:complete len:510 (-),score=123.11 gnl/TRDRNA2_/TRDRNA2_36270_c0_seq1:126-1601(-)